MATIETFEEYKELTLQAAADFNEKEYNKALKNFSKLAENNPNNPKIHEVLMFIHLRLGNYDAAQQEYQLCIKLLKEELPQKYFGERKTFKTLVEEVGEKKELEKEFDTLLKTKTKIDPYDTVETVTHLGILYMADGDYKKAEQLLLEAKEKLLQSAAS